MSKRCIYYQKFQKCQTQPSWSHQLLVKPTCGYQDKLAILEMHRKSCFTNLDYNLLSLLSHHQVHEVWHSFHMHKTCTIVLIWESKHTMGWKTKLHGADKLLILLYSLMKGFHDLGQRLFSIQYFNFEQNDSSWFLCMCIRNDIKISTGVHHCVVASKGSNKMLLLSLFFPQMHTKVIKLELI